MRATNCNVALASIGYAVLAMLTMIGSSNPLLRCLAAIPLVLFLPGHSVLRAALRTRHLDLQAVALSVALSMAIAVIGGIVLDEFDLLTRSGWALLFGVVIIVPSLFTLRRAAPVASQPMVRTMKAGRLGSAMGALAVIIALGAFGLARSGAAQQREYAFTEFWMVRNAALGGNVVTVGIGNQEKSAASYDVMLLSDGAGFGRRSGITVNSGDTWSEEVPLNGQLGSAGRIEAWLFKADAPDTIYRKVWLSRSGDAASSTKDPG